MYITDGITRVLAEDAGVPTITMHSFGKGTGVYLSGYKHDEVNNRTLLNLILRAAGESLDQKYITDNSMCECCYYPGDKQLVIINNSDREETTTVKTDFGSKTVKIAPFDTAIIKLD